MLGMFEQSRQASLFEKAVGRSVIDDSVLWVWLLPKFSSESEGSTCGVLICVGKAYYGSIEKC